MDDPKAKALLDAHRPVVLTGGDFVAPAENWTVEYLTQHAAEYNNVTKNNVTVKHPSGLMTMVSDEPIFKYAGKEGGIMHYEELEQVSTLRFLHVGPYQPHCLYTGEDGVVIIKLCTTLLRSAAEPCWSDA